MHQRKTQSEYLLLNLNNYVHKYIAFPVFRFFFGLTCKFYLRAELPGTSFYPEKL